VFIVGSIAWGIAFDSFRPDRYDLAAPPSAWSELR
jgi:drug/metabolite transporter superfamily protein YnfA